jgi:hypothetical protein
MELKIVQHKTFKKIFVNFLVICMIIIAAGFILYKKRIALIPAYLGAFSLSNVFIYAAIGLLLVFAFYAINNNNKQKLKKLDSFDKKISFYERFYTRRLWWHVISCLTSVIFLQLTFHYIFFYFGLFDLLSMLSAYPSKEVLKKELDEEDLIFN